MALQSRVSSVAPTRRRLCPSAWGLIACLTLALGLPARAEVRVLTEHSPPGEYLDESGRVTGPTAEMIRELMKRLGEPGEIELLPWKRAYDYALKGPQVALFETARTPEREALFKWVGPIKRIQWGLYARKAQASPLSDLQQARQVERLCAYLGDGKADTLKQQGFDNLYQPVLSAQCLEMLLRGRVDLWLTSDIEKDALLQENSLPANSLQAVLKIDSLDLYIAFSADTPDALVQRWQAELDAMKRDGSLARFYRGTYSDSLIEELSQVR